MNTQNIKRMITNALNGMRQALRGRVSRTDNASKQVILLQLEGVAGESFNATELFQQPGLRSVPLAGMQPIIVPLNGKSANGVVVAISNGALFITDLKPGEVALFNENDGVANSLILRNGKIAELTCDTLNIKATAAVNIDSPIVSMSGNLEVTGNTKTATLNVTSPSSNASHMNGGIHTDSDVIASGISLKQHVHGGVSSGVGTTGQPQ